MTDTQISLFYAERGAWEVGIHEGWWEHRGESDGSGGLLPSLTKRVRPGKELDQSRGSAIGSMGTLARGCRAMTGEA